MEGSAGQRSLPRSSLGEGGGRRGGRTERGRVTDLVGGGDPLARLLEQLLVPPLRVLAGQPLRAQVVVAAPQQARRLQEGVAVPSLRREGWTRRGAAGEELGGGATAGSATLPSAARPAPRPPQPAPRRRPAVQPPGPRCSVAGSAAVPMSGGLCASRGRRGRAPTPAARGRSSAARRCTRARSHRWRCRPAGPSPRWSAGAPGG